MPYAITLRLDEESAALVVAMWRALASAGLSNEALQLGYPPHITLAVCPDAADPGLLIQAARQCASRWRPETVTIASLGVFPGQPATLFLAPVPTRALLERHAELLALLATATVDPHYRAGCWVPHVTLADDLTDPAAALAAPGATRLPIVATLETIELVRFRPITVLASHNLAGE
jgi:2'-5' RNA ligase